MGVRGIMNGTPTPSKLEEEPGQIRAQWTGVGVPFIIPRSPRARQWSEAHRVPANGLKLTACPPMV
jgi:hypothetical protein